MAFLLGLQWIYEFILMKKTWFCTNLRSVFSYKPVYGKGSDIFVYDSIRRREGCISVPMNSLEWTDRDLWDFGLAFADCHMLSQVLTLSHSCALSPAICHAMKKQMLNLSYIAPDRLSRLLKTTLKPSLEVYVAVFYSFIQCLRWAEK